MQFLMLDLHMFYYKVHHVHPEKEIIKTLQLFHCKKTKQTNKQTKIKIKTKNKNNNKNKQKSKNKIKNKNKNVLANTKQ